MILLVEDNPETGALFSEYLTGAGYAVEWVRSGTDAVQRLAANPYELALMDLSLPDFNGVEASRQAADAGSATPVVAVSGAMELYDPVKVAAGHFVAEIAKPLRLSALLDLVKQHAKDGDSK